MSSSARVGLRKRQAKKIFRHVRSAGTSPKSPAGFVRRNSAIFRTHPQGGSKDAGAAPASFEPPCGCVRKIAELRRTKPAGDCAISPHVRFACLFLNPTRDVRRQRAMGPMPWGALWTPKDTRTFGRNQILRRPHPVISLCERAAEWMKSVSRAVLEGRNVIWT